MTTTDTNKGLIAGIRDRLRRSTTQGDRNMADIVKRGDYPMTEWEPLRLVRELMRMDPLRAMGLMPHLERDMWMPGFEVRENGNALRIMADVPGVKREDLEVTVTGNRLFVSGHREVEEKGKDENIHAFERSFGSFTRSFLLPDTAATDQITSELREGVLTIVVPMKAGAGTRKVPIGSGQPKH
jgi:HSP20 family protein